MCEVLSGCVRCSEDVLCLVDVLGVCRCVQYWVDVDVECLCEMLGG